MLWIGNKKVGKLWIGNKAVSALWIGSKKVWEAVASCFGKGYWIEEAPWSEEDGWVDE